jgi:uncharacterized membrane protein YedE/YeeE
LIDRRKSPGLEKSRKSENSTPAPTPLATAGTDKRARTGRPRLLRLSAAQGSQAMLESAYSPQIAGGVLIGTACAILMLGNGRTAGISGIARGLLVLPGAADRTWRALFVAGLIVGGWAGVAIMGDALPPLEFRWPLPVYVVAGLLVGVGAGLANGCTSGHGVCGTARLSGRSLAGNAIYLAVGVLVVTLMNIFF